MAEMSCVGTAHGAAHPKERGLVCTADSVRKIRMELKTQTRRLIKPQPHPSCAEDGCGWHWHSRGRDNEFFWNSTAEAMAQMIATGRTPYGFVGDRLYVKEVVREFDMSGDKPIVSCEPWEFGYEYKADGPEIDLPGWRYSKWKSPRFMPREAARVLLEITNIRVEQLNSISEEDAKAEGVLGKLTLTNEGEKFLYFGHPCIGSETARDAFIYLWDEIHNPRGYCAEDNPFGWDANPWVFVINFKLLDGKGTYADIKETRSERRKNHNHQAGLLDSCQS